MERKSRWKWKICNSGFLICWSFEFVSFANLISVFNFQDSNLCHESENRILVGQGSFLNTPKKTQARPCLCFHALVKWYNWLKNRTRHFANEYLWGCDKRQWSQVRCHELIRSLIIYRCAMIANSCGAHKSATLCHWLDLLLLELLNLCSHLFASQIPFVLAFASQIF